MEALVRLIDRGPEENNTKRGDVITVMPDDHPWSEAERTNPDWLIIKTPDLLNTDRDTMLNTGQNFPMGRFRRREWFLDLDNAPLPGRFTHPRKQESVTMTRLGLISILTQKPPLV